LAASAWSAARSSSLATYMRLRSAARLQQIQNSRSAQLVACWLSLVSSSLLVTRNVHAVAVSSAPAADTEQQVCSVGGMLAELGQQLAPRHWPRTCGCGQQCACSREHTESSNQRENGDHHTPQSRRPAYSWQWTMSTYVLRCSNATRRAMPAVVAAVQMPRAA
jgi:hypothetical protein